MRKIYFTGINKIVNKSGGLFGSHEPKTAAVLPGCHSF